VSVVLLSPHNDDAELFACWALLEHAPHVIVCLKSDRMGQVDYPGPVVTAETREAETDAAMRLLGCTWAQWPFLDSAPQWSLVAGAIGLLADRYDHCIAPAVEEGGHEQHNVIGRMALESFGPERVTQYLTYTRLHGRSTDGREVPVDVARKRCALDCYESQRTHPMTAAHFKTDLREFVLA
jgi:LmbE family N-acetylglucosaminyl deacetylase